MFQEFQIGSDDDDDDDDDDDEDDEDDDEDDDEVDEYDEDDEDDDTAQVPEISLSDLCYGSGSEVISTRTTKSIYSWDGSPSYRAIHICHR